MKASILDLRRRMGDVLKAIQRNETVTLLHRGKAIAIIQPDAGRSAEKPVAGHEVFGMWTDRTDLGDVGAVVDKLRKGRFDAL